MYKNYKLSIHMVSIVFNFSVWWREYFGDYGGINLNIYIWALKKTDDYTFTTYVAIFNFQEIVMLILVMHWFEIRTTIAKNIFESRQNWHKSCITSGKKDRKLLSLFLFIRHTFLWTQYLLGALFADSIKNLFQQ